VYLCVGCLCVCVYLYVYVCVCMYVCVCVRVRVCVCACVLKLLQATPLWAKVLLRVWCFSVLCVGGGVYVLVYVYVCV